MHVLMVDIHVKPERRDAYIAAISENAAAANLEPGCIRFDVVQNHADQDHFLLYEVYRVEDAYHAHRETEHFKRYVGATTDTYASDPMRLSGSYVYSPDA